MYIQVFQLSPSFRFPPPKHCIHLSSPHTPHAPPTSVLDLTTLVLLGEEYKSWSASVCWFLNPALTSSLLRPNIFLSILPSNTISLRSVLHVRDKCHTHTKQHENYSSVYHPEWPNEGSTLKTLSSGEIIALQNRNPEQIYLPLGLNTRQYKTYKTKRGASRKNAQYHITATVYIQPLLPLLMWSTQSRWCICLSWQWGSCDPLISQAMPMVAQLLAGSPMPDRSRVSFRAKKDTPVFQVKAWALGWHPNL